MAKHYIKKVLGLILAVAMMVVSPVRLLWADNEYTEGVGATAEGYIVYNADTGEIITGKNIHERYYPASITKIMTALLLIENCYNFEEVITFSHSAVTTITSDSSTLPPVAKEGERMTVKDVLFGMFLASGNECANMLAEYVAGDTDSFAQMMNDRAALIGAKDTHFVNAHGLHDDNHYTTPYDMALIFNEALKNPSFRELASTVHYTIPKTNMTEARSIEMGHRIVAQASGYLCEGVYAGKTGRTKEAGRTLATASKRNGVTLITIVMKSLEESHYNDTIGLINYAYDLLDGSVTEVNWLENREEVAVFGTSSGLNVRQFPTTGAAILGRLEEGAVVVRVATWDNYWSKIEYNGGYYYASSAYLKPTSEIPIRPTETPTVTQAPTEPTTTPVATIDIIIPSGSDDTKSTEEQADISGENWGDPQEDESSTEGLSMVDPEETHNGAKSEFLQKIIVICVVLMVLILVIAVVTELFPRRSKRKRRNSRIYHSNDWFR